MDADRIVAQAQEPRVSDAGRAFIEGWEGCGLVPYQDGAGNWTIGFGHRLYLGDSMAPITAPQADVILDFDLYYETERVIAECPNPLSQQQLDALVSFAHNVGLYALAISPVRSFIAMGAVARAADAMLAYNKRRDPATGALVVDVGLDKRRHAERDLFLNGDYSGRP